MIIFEQSKNTYLVGGCVRDMLLGRTPKDFDIVTDTKIEVLQPELESNGWQIKGVGESFLVYVVSKNGEQYDVANFRKDGNSSDGRRPDEVSIGTLEEDAARRDFTINSIYWNPITNQYIDPNGGMIDIKRKKLRFIGKPHDRIREDYLRVFRFYRFWATLDLIPDDKSFRACREMYNEAHRNTTPERVRNEIERMINVKI